MEGYSVTEAASVLGVPTERVWELLARGVLAGAPEGDTGMRVYLQPRPAPPTPEPSRHRGNGGTAEPERELSPFRELLTEFRNLTERYGQALLALGEARGEVASLRSRVDLLEARMDLRLPPGSPSGPMSWAQPTPEREDRPPMPAATPMEPEPEAVADAEPRSSRRSSPRRATESFAEALARAEDPSVPELPGGTDAAAALSALRSMPSPDEAPVPEAALPRELPPAEEMPVADEELSSDAAPDAPSTTPGEEPESVAAPTETDETPEAESVEVTPSVEAAPAAAAVDVAAVVEPEPEDAGIAAVDPEPDVEPESVEPDPQATGVAAKTTTMPDDAPSIETEPEGPAWQDERYTAAIAEPDWFEGEAFEQASPTVAPPADEAAESAPATPAEPEGEAATAPDSPERPEATEPDGTAPVEPEAEAPGPPVASDRAVITRLRPSSTAPTAATEETVLWFGRSPAAPEPAAGEGDADGMEVAPTGRPQGDVPAAGSSSLDDAFAALEALSQSTPGREDASPPAPARPPSTAPPRPVARQLPPTPATRAYRRLRRIFPG